MATKSNSLTGLRRRIADLEKRLSLSDHDSRYNFSRQEILDYIARRYRYALPGFEYDPYGRVGSLSLPASEIKNLRDELFALKVELGSQSAAIENQENTLHQIVAEIEKQGNILQQIVADFHYWVAVNSLEVDSTAIRMTRFVPVRVYLSDTPNKISSVSDALSRFAAAFGFPISDEFPAVYGSWFKKYFAKTAEFATRPEVAERLSKIERAVELQGLSKPQAEIDVAQSTAVSNLLAAIKDIPNAALQVGSILVIKLERGDGSIVHVKTLTSSELIHLENNQDLLSSPGDVLAKLTALSQARSKYHSEITHTDRSMKGDVAATTAFQIYSSHLSSNQEESADDVVGDVRKLLPPSGH